MPIPGSEILGKALHLVSQSLLLPVIAGLLLFIAFAVMELGGLFAEFARRTKVTAAQVEKILQKLHKSPELAEIIAESGLSAGQKAVLQKILANSFLPAGSLQSLARRLIEEEELKSARALEKTDVVARLGPSLGLMGTLIPLGPGLAALGAGNVEGLAEAVIIAFDTTVVGLAAGGIAYLISKVRKRWYEEHISTLEAVIEPLLEVLENAKKKKNIVQIKGGC
jgi:biopolymer transport protein ExbB/TolQ